MKLPPALFALVLVGAAAPSPRLHAASDFVRALPTPAAPDSQCSNLTAAPDGTLHLTWSAPSATAGERALYLSTLAPAATAWSEPRVIVSSPLLMENWADFASLVVGTDGALTAQWFQKPDASAGGHGYDGWYSRSTDEGKTWRTPARLGHEFVALAPLSGGRTLAVWLESARVRDPLAAPRSKRDPNAPRPARDPSAAYAPSMKLLARLLAPDGSALGEWTVDPDVCTCCQNTLASLPGDRVFVAYRGHTADETRDNKFSIFDPGARTFSPPAALRDDGWKIAACPVNGPAADARGEALAVAWFTAAEGKPQVFARLSNDAGRTLAPAVRLDLGRPLGRIETVMLADRSALFIWLEIGTAENAAGIYARRLFPDGKLSAPQLVAESTQARASGFPRAAQSRDGRIVVSWTQTGELSRVQLREINPGLLVASSASSAPRAGTFAALEFCEPVAVAHGSLPPRSRDRAVSQNTP